MSGPNTERSLKLSNIDAFLCSLMVGAGESYFPAFALANGMGEVLAGFLAALPLVGGAVLQLFTPRLLHKVQSHKSWVVGLVVFQAMTFLPLIYFSMGVAPNFWVLFTVFTLYWGASFSAGSAWTFWMGRLVPGERSANYLSRRGRISQVGILLGIVGGGLALHAKISFGPFSSVFGLLFAFAFLCRSLSSFVLSKKVFVSEWANDDQVHRLRDSWKIFWNGEHKKKFFLYLVPFQMAVNMSAPFVTPYMLAQIKMNYAEYMMAIAAMMVGKIISLSILQSIKRDLNGFRLLVLGIVLVSPMPALWALGTDFYFIIALQILSGLTWGCFEVALSMIFFKDLKQTEKIPVLTMYNLLNSVAIIAGTFMGGSLLEMLGEQKSSYWALYVVGAGLRVAFCIPLVRQAMLWNKLAAESPAANSLGGTSGADPATVPAATATPSPAQAS